MQKNDVYKTGIFKKDAEILRVLKIKEGKALVVDCVKSQDALVDKSVRFEWCCGNFGR